MKSVMEAYRIRWLGEYGFGAFGLCELGMLQGSAFQEFSSIRSNPW